MAVIAESDLLDVLQARLGLPTLDGDSTPTRKECQFFLAAAQKHIVTVVPPESIPELHHTYTALDIPDTADALNKQDAASHYSALLSIKRNGVPCAEGHVSLATSYDDPRSMYYATPTAPVWWHVGPYVHVRPLVGPLVESGRTGATDVPFEAVALRNAKLFADVVGEGLDLDQHLHEAILEYAMFCARGQLKIPGLAAEAYGVYEKALGAFIANRPVL